MDINTLGDRLSTAWHRYGDLALLGIGGCVLIVLAIIGYRFAKSSDKADMAAKISAIVVMAWTSEGVLTTALELWNMPVQFVGVTFFVFETMYIAAYLYAEKSRRKTGSPGPAGWYMFVIGVVQGGIAAAGAGIPSLGFMRVALPVLSLGLMLIFMCAPREDDDPSIVGKREARKKAREATWVLTPNIVLIWMGLKVAGEGTSATTAQYRRTVKRMVAAADTLSLHSGKPGKREPRRVVKARQRLRLLMRSATPQMIADVRRLAVQAAAAEILVVPSSSALDVLQVQVEDNPAAALGPLQSALQVLGSPDLMGDLVAPTPDPVGQVAPTPDLTDDPVADLVVDHRDQIGQVGQQGGTNGHQTVLIDLVAGTSSTEVTRTGSDLATRSTDLVALTDSVDVRDRALLKQYGDQLKADFNNPNVKVTAYRVGQIAGVDRRAAERLIAIVATEIYGDTLRSMQKVAPLTLEQVANLCRVASGPAQKIIDRL